MTEPQAPPATPRRTNTKVKGWRKHLRDEMVVTMRLHDQMSFEEIGRAVGVTRRGAERIYADYLKHRAAAPELLQRDPVDLARASLARMQAIRTALITLAVESGDDNAAVAVGALRTALKVEHETTELLQALGALPEDIAQLRWLVEMRGIGDRLHSLLDRLEAGELTAGEARDEFDAFMGVPRELVEGDAEVVDGAEAA